MPPFLVTIFDQRYRKAQDIMERMKEWVNQRCFIYAPVICQFMTAFPWAGYPLLWVIIFANRK